MRISNPYFQRVFPSFFRTSTTEEAHGLQDSLIIWSSIIFFVKSFIKCRSFGATMLGAQSIGFRFQVSIVRLTLSAADWEISLENRFLYFSKNSKIFLSSKSFKCWKLIVISRTYNLILFKSFSPQKVLIPTWSVFSVKLFKVKVFFWNSYKNQKFSSQLFSSSWFFISKSLRLILKNEAINSYC